VNESKPEACEVAEIIYEKPLSGDFEELLFGSDKGNTLWVKFSDKDGINEWMGKFGVGGQGSGRVIKILEPDRFFISAGGFAYIIDATTRKLIRQYRDENVLDMAYDVQKNLLITAGYTKLRWIDHENKVLTVKDIAVDGIRDLKIEGRILSGLTYKDYGDEKEQRFCLDLDKLKILRWEKPWWKFW
jgi:hypothetical protein